MKTFPDYLIVQMKKFTFGADWTPKKLDVFMDVPDMLNLADLRARGLQPGEQLLPEEPSTPPPGGAIPVGGPVEPPFEPIQNFLDQLKEMGFDENGCRRALFHTKNAGVEPAMNWILEHMADPDFASPFVPPSSNPAQPAPLPVEFQVDAEALVCITSMGLEERHGRLALKMNVSLKNQGMSSGFFCVTFISF